MVATRMLDSRILLLSKPSHIASYLLHTARKYGEDAVSTEILRIVELDAVPPIVLPIWLSVAQTMKPIEDALQQSFSVLGRKAAIRRIGKLLKSHRWTEVWQSLGDTKGLLKLCAALSVEDLALLMNKIGSSWCNRNSTKEKHISELFEHLWAPPYATLKFENLEQRPLKRFYLDLLPACSEACVTAALGHKSIRAETLPEYRIYLAHPSVLERIDKEDCKTKGISRNLELLYTLAKGQSSQSVEARGFSASMNCSLDLLKLIVDQPNGVDCDHSTAQSIIESLLKRSIKKRVPKSDLFEVIQLGIKYFRRYSDQRPRMNGKRGILMQVARYWGAWRFDKEPVAEDPNITQLLEEILRLTPKQSPNDMRYEDLLKSMAWSRRYKIFCLAALNQLNVNLASIDDLKRWKGTFFSLDQVFLLRRDEAIELIERLLQVKPGGDFLQCSGTRPILCSDDPSTSYVDINILLTYLRNGNAKAIQDATVAVASCQKKATSSRDQPVRAFHAKRALFWATVSGSQTLLNEVVVWSKRFVRDALTVKEIYSQQVIANDDVVTILSGLSRWNKEFLEKFSSKDIEGSIKAGNEVLVNLFRIAISALREPSFYQLDWTSILQLFRFVVQKRLDWTNQMQPLMPQSSTQSIFRVIWEPTIDMLIDIERQGLLSGNDALYFNGSDGPLRHGLYYPTTIRRPAEACIVFLDRYAKARDTLWEEHRMTINPLAATIPSPYPKGLPIQSHLQSFDLSSGWTEEAAPYLVSRARNLVFLDVRQALAPLPTNEGKKAIGSFIDNFATAVTICILQDDNKELQASRSREIWSHWITIYRCRDSISKLEAALLLKRDIHSSAFIFQNDFHDDYRCDFYPQLPKNDGEWNPAAEEPANINAMGSTTCFIDVSIAAHNGAISTQDSFVDACTWSVVRDPTQFWNLTRFSTIPERISAEFAEGLVLSALLYLDDRKFGGPRLLTSKFPSEANQRYPSVFLDENFLERKDINDRFVPNVLHQLRKRLPSSLVQGLTQAYMKALSAIDRESAEFSGIERLSFELLRLLQDSDRPNLASTIIVRTILDNPNSSSWHRQILKAGNIRRLAAADARDLVESSSQGIIASLQEQEQGKKDVSDEDDKSPVKQQGGRVKVTTVKSLAQLLQSGDFFSEEGSVQILQNLFKQSNHPDIRVAVVASLKERLWYCKDESSDDLAEKILLTLEGVIPYISALDERRPITEEEWLQAEQTLTIPERESSQLDYGWPPILDQVIQGISVPNRWQHPYVKRIILPAIEASRMVGKRWLRLVLRKHRGDENLADLAIPFTPSIMESIIGTYSSYMTVSQVANYHRWVLANIDLPSEIVRMNEYFRKDHVLLTSPACKIWLELFSKSPVPKTKMNLITMLNYKWPETNRDDGQGLTVQHVQHMALQQARALLKTESDPDFKDWNTFITRFEPHPHSKNFFEGEDRKAWKLNAKPVLLKLIALIDAQRTVDWQHGKNRVPQLLPTTLRLRTWLLPYPILPGNSFEDFAKGVLDMVEEISQFPIARRILSSTENIMFLQRAVEKLSPEDILRTAFILEGMVDIENDKDASVNFLTLQLVSSLFGNCFNKPLGKDLLENVKNVLKKWQRSTVEEVRMLGLKLLKVFPKTPDVRGDISRSSGGTWGL